MSKYKVFGHLSAFILIGEYEAESKEAAEKMAENDDSADWYPSLCHQCSSEVELGDINKVEVVE